MDVETKDLKSVAENHQAQMKAIRVKLDSLEISLIEAATAEVEEICRFDRELRNAVR